MGKFKTLINEGPEDKKATIDKILNMLSALYQKDSGLKKNVAEGLLKLSNSQLSGLFTLIDVEIRKKK